MFTDISYDLAAWPFLQLVNIATSAPVHMYLSTYHPPQTPPCHARLHARGIGYSPHKEARAR